MLLSKASPIPLYNQFAALSKDWSDAYLNLDIVISGSENNGVTTLAPAL